MTATADSTPVKSVVLWAWPRTRSTVFERLFMARPAKDVEVQHELLSAPMYWSQTRVSNAFDDATCMRRWSDYWNCTYESEWKSMTTPPADKQAVFAKDLTKHAMPPRDIRAGALDPPDFEKDGNPTYIPSTDLLDPRVQHVFLIRDIRQSIPSWARLGVRSDVGIGHFDEDHLGIRQSVELFDFLKTKLSHPPVVIDSDDLLKNAEGVARLLCGMLAVEYQPEMLAWPKDEKVEAAFKKWEGWHDEVANSSSISADLTPANRWESCQDSKDAIAKYWDQYMYLKGYAHVF